MSVLFKYSCLLVLTSSIALLSACSGTKETLGLNRQSPDEFKVVKRAPLEMPPGYGLRPPAPGAPRPQEQAPETQAKASLLGADAIKTSSAQSDGEAFLLQDAGADIADPAIRQKVNAETVSLKDRNKPVVQKILGVGGGRDETAATIVDAKAEAQRIKQNKDAGRPVTEGTSPSIED